MPTKKKFALPLAYWKILGAVAIWTVTVFFTSILSDLIFPDSPNRFTGVGLFKGTKQMVSTLVRWDAVHYFAIAYHGYIKIVPGLKAFFPLYSLIIRAGAWFTKGFLKDALDAYLITAILVNLLSLVGALWIIQRIAEREYGEKIKTGFPPPLLMLGSPWAFFYLSPYPEALTLFLSVAAFCAAMEKKWLLAGLLAGIASGCRLQGAFLFPALVVEYACQKEWNWKKIRWDAVWLLLCPTGFIAYMRYLGGVGVFLGAQEKWPMRKVGISIFLAFTNYFDRAWRGLTERGTAIALDERISYHFAFIVLVISVLLTGCFWKKLRPSFRVYLILSFLIPILSSSLMAIQRYALLLFPLSFAGAHFFEERPTLFWVSALVCGIWSCFFIALFTNGFFVS